MTVSECLTKYRKVFALEHLRNCNVFWLVTWEASRAWRLYESFKVCKIRTLDCLGLKSWSPALPQFQVNILCSLRNVNKGILFCKREGMQWNYKIYKMEDMSLKVDERNWNFNNKYLMNEISFQLQLKALFNFFILYLKMKKSNFSNVANSTCQFYHILQVWHEHIKIYYHLFPTPEWYGDNHTSL